MWQHTSNLNNSLAIDCMNIIVLEYRINFFGGGEGGFPLVILEDYTTYNNQVIFCLFIFCNTKMIR